MKLFPRDEIGKAVSDELALPSTVTSVICPIIDKLTKWVLAVEFVSDVIEFCKPRLNED